MKGKLPVSKAKTAYGLLSEIAALAIAEPKRMLMSEWKITLETVTEEGIQPKGGFPACGTVGCIGGWVETLKPSSPGAGLVLGLSVLQEDDLFFGDLCSAPNQQTAKHAHAVARHIRRFQKKYRTQLLAKKV